MSINCHSEERSYEESAFPYQPQNCLGAESAVLSCELTTDSSPDSQTRVHDPQPALATA